jgi:hypothetical protein
MVNATSMAARDGFTKTDRKDAWWIEPLLIGLGFAAFGIYATWAALQGVNYEWGPYLSPFYSPLLNFDWLPTWMSPAFLILPFPLIFRATCYYYRKAYYRAYFANPPACAVGGDLPMKGDYKGETAFPFVLQNLHRYTLYIAILFIVLLWYDALQAFFFDGRIGMGLGTLIMVINVVLLSLYTFSCHSWRHLIGGRLDCFSCSVMNQARQKAWGRISHLNEHHMRWAWLSLFSVGFTDFYIRMVASGVFQDVRFF